MPRFAIKLEYHGAPFHGWQRQEGPASVQAAIEAALSRIAPEGPVVQGAGRTDTGVHATGQVAHLDLLRDWDPFRLGEALNYHLKPLPISVLAAAPVADDFHARFSAVERRYEYRIVNRRAPLTYGRGLAWRVGNPLDVSAMQEGADCLVGRHDFTTFRASICQAKSPVKSLDLARIERGEGREGAEILCRFQARSFLHNQIRSFVGTLERVGSGAWQPGDVARALAARDRAACGPVAPPDGLYLTDVLYPTDPFGA